MTLTFYGLGKKYYTVPIVKQLVTFKISGWVALLGPLVIKAYLTSLFQWPQYWFLPVATAQKNNFKCAQRFGMWLKFSDLTESCHSKFLTLIVNVLSTPACGCSFLIQPIAVSVHFSLVTRTLGAKIWVQDKYINKKCPRSISLFGTSWAK